MIDVRQLHALADGELSESEAKSVRDELLTDVEAVQELNAIYNLKDCLRAQAATYTCDVTWGLCAKRISEVDRARRVESFVGRYAWGISGAFLAAIFVGNLITHSRQEHQVGSDELASVAAKLIPSGHNASTAPTPYSQWLDSLLPQARATLARDKVVRVASMPVEIGGRECGRFEFQDRAGVFYILVIPGQVQFDGMDSLPSTEPYATSRINGLNWVARSVGGQSIVVIAPRTYDQLAQIASHIAAR